MLSSRKCPFDEKWSYEHNNKKEPAVDKSLVDNINNLNQEVKMKENRLDESIQRENCFKTEISQLKEIIENMKRDAYKKDEEIKILKEEPKEKTN